MVEVVTIAALLATPWLMASGWLASVAIRHFNHPMRGSLGEQWECRASVYYLLWAPVLTTATIVAHVLVACQVHACGAEYHVPMGHMFLRRPPARFWRLERLGMLWLIRGLCSPYVRALLVCSEVSAVAFGALLGYRGLPMCSPDLWWGIVVLLVSTVVAASAAVLSSVGLAADLALPKA